MTSKGKVLTLLTAILSILAGAFVSYFLDNTRKWGSMDVFGFLISMVFVWWVYCIVVYAKEKQ